MNIEIFGKTKNMCKAEIKFATAFFAQYLMGTRLAKNLDIDLFFEGQGHAEGHCNPIEAPRKPRVFEIGVNPKLQRYKILQVLAHEMVHVKQYARGELSNDTITAKFNGKKYKLTNSFEDYLNWPWEIEAYGRDRALYLFYCSVLKDQKIKFKRGKIYVRNKLVPKIVDY
jgi:hypothetical protein